MEKKDIERFVNLNAITHIDFHPMKKLEDVYWRDAIDEVSTTNWRGKKEVITQAVEAGWYDKKSNHRIWYLRPALYGKTNYIFLDKDGNISEDIDPTGSWAKKPFLRLYFGGTHTTKRFSNNDEARKHISELETLTGSKFEIAITDIYGD